MQAYWVDGGSRDREQHAQMRAAHAVLCELGGGTDRDRGVWQRAPLGAHVGVAGPRGALGARAARSGVRARQQERRDRRAGDLERSARTGPALGAAEGRATAGGAEVLHRERSQWVKVCTQVVNGLRGLLYEFGVALPGERQAGLKAMRRAAGKDAGLGGIVRAA